MMKAAGVVVALAIFGSTLSVVIVDRPLKVDDCTCTDGGNIYEAHSADGCKSFFQSAFVIPRGKILCPPGQLFDVNICSCNWPSNVECPKECQPKTEKPVPLDRSNVTCTDQGNTYTIVAGTDCLQFEQMANDGTGQTKIHKCPKPDILGFDVNTCVCNLKTEFDCPI